jgi:hypothetical protein
MALIGFAQTNGRLPCPATATGTSNPNGSGPCFVLAGFLPGTTLGVQPTDEQGFVVDAWNNRIRYALTSENANAFSITNGMSNLGITALTPNLNVCATTGCAISLINNAVAVIFSMGPTGAEAIGGNDEDENINNDIVFVSHTSTAAAAVNGEFDHIVTWLSPYVLYNAMIEAGQLH